MKSYSSSHVLMLAADVEHYVFFVGIVSLPRPTGRRISLPTALEESAQ
jgi:hypothetical protein